LAHDVCADRIGRIIITKLSPGLKISLHQDMGAPNNYYQRFHVAIQSDEGQVFKCGDEEFTPENGEVYAFNNSLEHGVENNSKIDRLTMIVDLRTPFLESLKRTYS
jgi:aspartyl/asparaginyl beta-hydroxylase (cupin superfamily)